MEQDKPIGARRRDLMFRVMDGYSDVAIPLYHVYSHVQCDEILRWLIANGKTGVEFKSWLMNQFQNSIVLMMAHIVRELRRDLEVKPIIVGRDYFVS